MRLNVSIRKDSFKNKIIRIPLALLLVVFLASGWFAERGDAAFNFASNGHVGSVTVDNWASGANATWTILFQYSVDVAQDQTMSLRTNVNNGMGPSVNIEFSSHAGDFLINGKPTAAISCYFGGCSMSAPESLAKDTVHVLTIRNSAIPDLSANPNFAFWMPSPANGEYSGVFSFTQASLTPAMTTAPAGIAHSDLKSNSATLTWNNVPSAAGYNIYRNGVKVNTAIIAGNSYTVTGLSESTDYSFTVSAVNDYLNESAQSSSIAVRTPAMFGLVLESAAGNKGEEVELALTLESDEGVDIKGIQFNVLWDKNELGNESFADHTDGLMQTNQVADSPRTYTVMFGSFDLSPLPEELATIKLQIAPSLGYNDVTLVALTNVVVVYNDNQSRSLADVIAGVRVADTYAPLLTLTPSTEELAESVGISIAGDGTGSGIAALKWAYGEQTLDYFQADNGNALHENTFTVSGLAAESVITVYAEDEAGNGAIATIVIDNAVLKGDVNGDGVIDIADWQLAANIILSRIVPTDRQLFAAQMNGDNIVNVVDWVLIANRLVNE